MSIRSKHIADLDGRVSQHNELRTGTMVYFSLPSVAAVKDAMLLNGHS